MPTRILLAAAVVSLVAFSAGAPREQYPIPMKVADRAPSAVHAFPMRDVKLLDGPFRAAMQRDEDYLLSLDPDRLLHTFRLTAGLPSSAEPLGGWEAPDVELRGHTTGHYLSALAIMYASTGDQRFKSRADGMVAELAKIQEAEAEKFHPGYLSAFPEEFFDRVEARQRVWAPYYTIHKIMAGLLDVHLLTGNQQALDVLKKQADWVAWRNGRLTEEQRQKQMQTEFGGMNEVLANLYAVTGDAKYFETAKMFEHKAIFDPLLNGVDPLDHLHANTQFPKIIGAAREYELTGDARYEKIATFFWDRVVHHRTYAMGGNSDGESFFPESEFSKHLGAAGPETCNTYNMLKLTRHLFAWSPSAEEMDFYERALFNHILGSQDPETGMVLYYCPLRPGGFRTFSTPTDSFWCCVGTGMENHGKYNDTIYFHDERSLYWNLFIPSELTWKDKGLVVRQETRFPNEDSATLTFTAAQSAPLALKVRYPSWATSGITLTVNGERQNVTAQPGSYVTIDRTWKTGDTVRVALPMSLHVEAMPDDPKVQAILYGPIVLAGDLGTTGLDGVKRYGPSAPPLGRVPRVTVPSLVAADTQTLLSKVEPVDGQPLHFRTVGVGRPEDVTLTPLYRTFEPRYNVYWTVYTPSEWKTHEAEVADAAAHRTEIERRSIDTVDVSDDASEAAHGYKGEGTDTGVVEGRRWRDARNGFISYELKIDGSRPVTLVCTFRGSEGRRRTFDIVVDGQTIATESLEYHPTELLDKEYKVPDALTRGKDRITVRLQPQGRARTGGVVEIRTVQ